MAGTFSLSVPTIDPHTHTPTCAAGVEGVGAIRAIYRWKMECLSASLLYSTATELDEFHQRPMPLTLYVFRSPSPLQLTRLPHAFRTLKIAPPGVEILASPQSNCNSASSPKGDRVVR